MKDWECVALTRLGQVAEHECQDENRRMPSMQLQSGGKERGRAVVVRACALLRGAWHEEPAIQFGEGIGFREHRDSGRTDRLREQHGARHHDGAAERGERREQALVGSGASERGAVHEEQRICRRVEDRADPRTDRGKRREQDVLGRIVHFVSGDLWCQLPGMQGVGDGTSEGETS